jgi:hypothetical protein
MSWTIDEPNLFDSLGYPVVLADPKGSTGVTCAVATYYSDGLESATVPIPPYVGRPKAYVYPWPPPFPPPPPPLGYVTGVPGAGGNNNSFLFANLPQPDIDNNPNSVYLWDVGGNFVTSKQFYGSSSDSADCGGGGGNGLRAKKSKSCHGCSGSAALTIPHQAWHLTVDEVFAALHLERLDLPWNPPGKDKKRLCVWKNKFKHAAGGPIRAIELQCESPWPQLFTLTVPGNPVAKYTLKARNFSFCSHNTLWQKLNPDGSGHVKKAPPCITIYPA